MAVGRAPEESAAARAGRTIRPGRPALMRTLAPHSPARCQAMAIRTRSRSPSLPRIRLTLRLVEAGSRTRLRAISALGSPSAMSRTMSGSRGVSAPTIRRTRSRWRAGGPRGTLRFEDLPGHAGREDGAARDHGADRAVELGGAHVLEEEAGGARAQRPEGVVVLARCHHTGPASRLRTLLSER